MRSLAEKLKGQRIDVLANNAGLVNRGTTVDGFNTTMQINHIAPPSVARPDARRLKDPQHLVDGRSRGRRPDAAGTALPQRLAGVREVEEGECLLRGGGSSYSFHPGVPRTRFGPAIARPFYRYAPGLATAEEGTDQLVWLSTAPTQELVDGAFYSSRRVVTGVDDKAAASRLWEATASLLDPPG